MKNVSEMNNGSLHSIILCFLNIVESSSSALSSKFFSPPPLPSPHLARMKFLVEGDMKKNYLFTAVIVYLRLFFFPQQYEASSTHIIYGMWRQKKGTRWFAKSQE